MIAAEAPVKSSRSPVNALAGILSSTTVLRANEPLAKRTTLRVGGPADIYVEPGTEDDLAAVLKFCRERRLAFFILGRGSNLLVRDGGFRGVVISLTAPFFSNLEFEEKRLRCGAGARLKTVAVEAKRRSISGLEFLEGIPGSIGGALRMNAGAMGASTFDVVESVRFMDYSGVATERAARDIRVEYRSCPALKTSIALSAVLRGSGEAKESIQQRMDEYSRKRWQSQPAAPSAGCMFKNAATIPAGKLIDELGLKGSRVGGAMVSMEHGNFIVNDGTATARDVLELVEIIKAKAKQVRGIDLHTEVEIIGAE